MTKARDLANSADVFDTVSTTELGYLDGVTSAVQTQLDGKVASSSVDAKGDLLVGSADNTLSRLAVGSNGDTLVADSAATTGLRWQGNYSAGKNKIINGDFGIWQRGTSFSNPANGAYTADRYKLIHDGTGATRTISQQTFTAGTAPVSGYEGQFFYRYAVTAAGTGNTYQGFFQPVEDVRTLAGQTAVISFWAKAGSNLSMPIELVQVFGSGGSADVYASLSSSSISLTTSWQRFSVTATVASISGKTIGTNSLLRLGFYAPANSTATIDLWGVQLEAGSVATAFQTATGTLQGELAACQRYYQVFTRDNFALVGSAYSTSAAAATPQFFFPMRGAPTITLATAGSGTGQMTFLTSAAAVPGTIGAFAAENITASGFRLTGTGFTSAFTAGNSTLLFCGSSAVDVWRASAEL